MRTDFKADGDVILVCNIFYVYVHAIYYIVGVVPLVGGVGIWK